MIPTVQNVYDRARAWVGDDQQSGGEVFTNTLLQQFYQFAYAELFRALQKMQNPRIRQEAFYDVPANTGFLDPATAGITNLGEIEIVEERGSVSSVNVGNAVPGSAVLTVTATAHGRSTGNQVVAYGIGGISADHIGLWTASVSDPNTLTLNGCTATGTYTSGGKISYSTEEFNEVGRVDRIAELTASPGGAFIKYSWQGDFLRFPPCSAVRQLRITYTLSGNAPTTTTASVGIDDSLDFLGLRAAALAFATRNAARAEQLNYMAVGPEWESYGIAGGVLGQLLDAGVRALQALPPEYRRPQSLRRHNRTEII